MSARYRSLGCNGNVWTACGDDEDDDGDGASVITRPMTILGGNFHAVAYEVVPGSDPQRVRQRNDDFDWYANASGTDGGFETTSIGGREYVVFVTPFDR